MLSYYSFTSFIRKGIANSVASVDDPATGNAGNSTQLARPSIEVTVNLAFDQVTASPRKQLDIYSVANVAGIDPRAIIRTVPAHYCTNAEPNYLASIDFFEEDFPWRFSPATAHQQAANNQVLTPWLALVVLKEDEFEAVNITSATADHQQLPFLRLTGTAQHDAIFVPFEELHLWAHAHTNADLTSSSNALQAQMDEDGDNCYARIICARRLSANTSYHAFLIPSFEAGRLAGMGNYDAAETTPVNAGSWANRQTEFPYYHSWYFATGAMGDFEYLARQLQPKPADQTVGYRPLTVPGITDALQLPGCLRVPLGTLPNDVRNRILNYENWAGATLQPWQFETAQEIDTQIGNDDDPVLTRPVYGRWHAKVEASLYQGTRTNATVNPANREWVSKLNLDPRYRAIAAIGVETIQKNQEELMDAAWDQVDAIHEANKKIRLAQLAIQVNKQFEKKVLANFTDEQFIGFASPLHKKVNAMMGLTPTLYQTIGKSAVPQSITNNLFRKVSRNTSSLARMSKATAQVFSNNVRLMDALNKSSITSFNYKKQPVGFITDNRFADAVRKQLSKVTTVVGGNILDRNKLVKLVSGAVRYDKQFKELVINQPDIAFKYEAAAPVFSMAPRLPVAPALPAPGRTRFPVTPVTGTLPGRLPDLTHVRPGRDIILPTKSAFIQALENTAVVFGIQDQIPVVNPVPLNIPAIRENLSARLQPTQLFKQWYAHLFPTVFETMPEPEEWFEPVMKYPEFTIPTYQYLKEKSTEFFLPNLNKIENNSITLLETNQAFIEAYMVGLNHEFSRELLWRGYPTDQRGSYFRLFWDSISNRKDVKELHTWNRALGFNNEERSDNNLVLVVRGDLLKKFPRTIIGVQKAAWKNNNVKTDREIDDDADFILPIFEAYLEPDLYFIGFNLKEEELVGKRDPSNAGDDPGYFFIMKERSGEPRFGLDEGASAGAITQWNQLSWAQVNTAANAVLKFSGAAAISFNRTSDDTQAAFPPSNSAQLAYLLHQQPALIAIHASRLLPKNN